MFRHQGKNRTFIHNLRLAIILSFVAGIVNINGVLSINILTTNVTGHFAYFAEEFMKLHYTSALFFLVFILFFLIGSFTSNFLAEIVSKKHPQLSHVLPILVEIMVLVVIGFFNTKLDFGYSNEKTIAFMLLFAMGIQNSLVTKISQATVRTTHLTGLFTDLGIELSQLFFYKKPEEVKKLKTSIFLRLSIITFFFLGCLIGGYLYIKIQFKTLFIAAFFLLLALLYDYIRLQFYVIKRKTFN